MLKLLFALPLATYIINRAGSLLREGKAWHIKKGKHYSNTHFFPVVLNHRKPGASARIEFSLNESMTYDLHSTDNGDWNKLVGEGSVSQNSIRYAKQHKDALHHYQSWRLVWSYDPDKRELTLGIYWYTNGVRNSLPILSIPNPNDGIQLNSKLQLNVYFSQDTTMFCIFNDISDEPLNTLTIPASFLGWTYRLRPFFGGNMPAPHDMQVQYKFI